MLITEGLLIGIHGNTTKTRETANSSDVCCPAQNKNGAKKLGVHHSVISRDTNEHAYTQVVAQLTILWAMAPLTWDGAL